MDRIESSRLCTPACIVTLLFVSLAIPAPPALWAAEPAREGSKAETGGAVVHLRATFDDGPEGWTAANGATLRIVDDAPSGKALEVACEGAYDAARIPIDIRGSRDLRMAFLMRGRGLDAAGVNIHDARSGDNTTPYGYRYIEESLWTPILYRLDRCRYNSRHDGFVDAETAYDEVRIWAPEAPRKGRLFAIDGFVLYRGSDRSPPGKVEGLRAEAQSDGVRLAWSPAPDDVGVQAYAVARARGDGEFEKVGETPTLAWVDVAAGRGEFRYRVLAVDFEENFGPWSDPAATRSDSPAVERKSSREAADRATYAESLRRIHAAGVGKVRRGHAVLFGDSLTGATVYPQCAEAAFRNVSVDAFGFASMTTRFGREHVREILDRERPEFLFVLFGTNNGKGEAEVREAMEDLRAIVEACADRGTVAALGTIPPRGWTPESEPEARYARAVAELCRELRIPAGYLFEAFQASGDRRRLLADDGVHWTGEGMEVAGRAWGRTFEEIRFALRDRE